MNAQPSIASIGFASRHLDQIATHLDRKYETAWCYLQPTDRPCFSTRLLTDLIGWCRFVEQNAAPLGIRYHVIASNTPRIFNLGGDLELFRRYVIQGDREGLRRYGIACIEPLFANIRHFNGDVTTLSLVQGEALGGGFETALSSDVLIAERQARMGFPEVLFNLFPGMGAYSLLARRLDPKRAEQMILSGRIYSAEELQAMGLVDILVETGEGEAAVYDYIKRENRARNGFRAVRKVRDYLHPIGWQELLDIVEIWVDTAMRLEPRDLRMMERLVARQHQQGIAAA
jgi:DSF synthase